MTALAREDITRRLMPGWTLHGDGIRKEYTFDGFPEAVQFVDRLAPEVEAADHHPDILISYKRVTLTFTTHSEGGVTVKDLDGATMADQLA